MSVFSSTDAPRRIVAISFASPLRAEEALGAALRLEERGLLTIHDAVIVNRSASGQTEVIETSDPSPAAAAVPTTLVGALVGTLLVGPIGLLVGGVLGGGAGAAAAKLLDTGIPDRVIDELSEDTRPGQASLILMVSDVATPAVLQELRGSQGAAIVYADADAEAQPAAAVRQPFAVPA